jgi:two-component SAPR family response regulator
MSRRVLIVEDDFLIALDLESVLQSAGFTVLGPVPSALGALDLIEKTSPDIALLDIHLTNGNVFSVADKLAAKKIPFAFLTGHSREFLPAMHSNRPVFSKPYETDGLVRDLRRLAA